MHNLKETVDHISTNKVLLYYWKSMFIPRFFTLFISTLSFLLFLYTVLWRYNRDASIGILLYIMLYIINTIKKQTLLKNWLLQDRDLNLTPPPPPHPPFPPLLLRPCCETPLNKIRSDPNKILKVLNSIKSFAAFKLEITYHLL